jgi:hypothetical protein
MLDFLHLYHPDEGLRVRFFDRLRRIEKIIESADTEQDDDECQDILKLQEVSSLGFIPVRLSSPPPDDASRDEHEHWKQTDAGYLDKGLYFRFDNHLAEGHDFSFD